MAIEGIHHFAISTPDIDRLIAFYRDMFGFARVFDSTWGEGSDTIDAMLGRRGTVARVAMLRTQTGFLELFQFSAPEPVPARPERSQIDHGYTHFCVNVTDIDAEYQRLLQAGVRFNAPPASMAPALMAAYCRDPDDNVIELLEILDESWPFHFSRRAGDPAHG